MNKSVSNDDHNTTTNPFMMASFFSNNDHEIASSRNVYNVLTQEQQLLDFYDSANYLTENTEKPYNPMKGLKSLKSVKQIKCN